jgi:xanthine dehydrogenase accessory factor
MRIWRPIANLLERGEPCALVTVLQVKGSAPREAGARMIVAASGGIHGTIGGGALEWQALSRAQRLIWRNEAEAVIEKKVLGPDLGQCCGGAIELLIERFEPADLAHVSALACAEEKGPFATLGSLGGRHLFRRMTEAEGDGPAIAFTGDGGIAERFGEHRRTVMLFGAGHVGRALMLALAPLPFDVRWVDPRPQAFPAHVAANVRLDGRPDPAAALAEAPDGAFVVVMTHSHALDLAIVDRALAAGRFAYVGVIGSATKRARFESRLRRMGHPDAVARSFVCPIGIPGIGSRLPAAIALSVAAQLLQQEALVKSAASPLNIAEQRA